MGWLHADDILTSSPWVVIDYDVRCMEPIPGTEAHFRRLTELAVTREDMQTLKDDWLTDNVGFEWLENPLG